MGLMDKLPGPKEFYVAGAIAVAGLMGGGCNQAATNAFSRSAGNALLGHMIRNELTKSNNTGTSQNTSGAYTVYFEQPESTIAMIEWRDDNNDGIPTRNEFLNDIGSSVDLSVSGVYVGINNRKGTTGTDYVITDSNNNVISRGHSSGGATLIKQNSLKTGNYTIAAKPKDETALSRAFKVR